MAKNITLLGASYSNVPAVNLPQTGGGTARFTDTSPTTATDSDVASGKIYFKSDGSQSTGTSSGGGGGGIEITQDAQGYIVLPKTGGGGGGGGSDYSLVTITLRELNNTAHDYVYAGYASSNATNRLTMAKLPSASGSAQTVYIPRITDSTGVLMVCATGNRTLSLYNTSTKTTIIYNAGASYMTLECEEGANVIIQTTG